MITNKTRLYRANEFLYYRENNIIYASYLSSFLVWALIEGAKYASTDKWHATNIYFTIAMLLLLSTAVIFIFSYVKKVIRPYLLRKYLIILLLVPLSLSYLSLSVLSYIDESVSINLGNKYFAIHILLMFIIRFWLINKWIAFDQERLPLRKGEKIYLGETSFKVNSRFDRYNQQ